MNNPPPRLIDPSLCPVCGQPNQCVMAMPQTSGLQAQPCWCNQVDFSLDLLQRMAPELRGRACICPRCAQGGDRS